MVSEISEIRKGLYEFPLLILVSVYEYPLKCRVRAANRTHFGGYIFCTPFRFLSLECDKTPYQGVYEYRLQFLVYMNIDYNFWSVMKLH
ncbi:unnamed protein product [Rotaria sp. Silwood1]|nr:unnamed protein product [Rotaria sp. Silwood1]CAF1685376.1 unnamed protein product [Rotaria sp. Silwood1]